MATFTMRLKDVLKATGGDWDRSTGISVITGGDIGLNDYPLFSTNHNPDIPDYRPILNGKIFDHFMMQEIGQETIGMFQVAMSRKMNEIMPFYNQMYLSTEITINPITTMHLTTENNVNDSRTTEANANTTGTTTATSAARAVTSDTPQTMLAGDEDYASGGTDTNSSGTNNSSGTQANNETMTDTVDGTTTIDGYQGSPSDLLMRYRDSFINVDMMIIKEIEEDCLFMAIWDTNDTYERHSGIGPISNFYGIF